VFRRSKRSSSVAGTGRISVRPVRPKLGCGEVMAHPSLPIPLPGNSYPAQEGRTDHRSPASGKIRTASIQTVPITLRPADRHVHGQAPARANSAGNSMTCLLHGSELTVKVAAHTDLTEGAPIAELPAVLLPRGGA